MLMEEEFREIPVGFKCKDGGWVVDETDYHGEKYR